MRWDIPVAYSSVNYVLQGLRPAPPTQFEHRFKTAPGCQAQVDFAQFKTVFAEDLTETVTLWLFTLGLGHSRICGAGSCGTRTC